ncbi:hypothetical protein [Amphritea sp. HPY]|uniref:hypothetical protein n=1 Tax=Amphritea sp. HPY TaxID=3421652 RepID=UPI003D7E0333
MLDKYIHGAADALVKRRLNNKLTARLEPCLRPDNADQALAIQQALISQMKDSTGHEVGGWKCALPFSENDLDEMPVAAPIFANTIYDRSPCPVRLDEGVCKIEPEIAFRFHKDLPSRSEPYIEQEVIAALSGAHLALELIQNRYLASEEASYLEHLGDCLFNQGLFIGPEITLDQAFSASEIEFTLTAPSDLSTSTTLAGKHPNKYPQLPLFWLVNFLSAQGIDIKAGQLVITSSYAGVIEVPPDQEFSLQYGELGSILLRFEVS